MTSLICWTNPVLKSSLPLDISFTWASTFSLLFKPVRVKFYLKLEVFLTYLVTVVSILFIERFICFTLTWKTTCGRLRFAYCKTKSIHEQKAPRLGTSLVVQWLRIHLPMQGTRVRALVREDPTCRGATGPVCHNYWARVPQLLKPAHLETVLHNKRSHHSEKPTHCNKE